MTCGVPAHVRYSVQNYILRIDRSLCALTSTGLLMEGVEERLIWYGGPQ
jgi:hypothetical protein